MKFMEKLSGSLTFFDGAMGTQLISRGLLAGESPETWNLKRPDEVLRVHNAYLDAGCDVIASNTFGAHPLRHENAAMLVRAGMALAREAADKCGRKAYVALDMGPTGRLLKPFGDLSFEEAYDSFKGIVEAGRDSADLILIETLSDLFEAKAAVLAAKEHSGLPVVVTMSLDEKGMLLTGGDLGAMAALLEGLGVDALGLNCGLGPDEMLKLLPRLRELTHIPLVLCPNAGLPVSVDGRAVYALSPEKFAKSMQSLALGGASGVGGCCGTTPEHLRLTTQLLQNQSPLPLPAKGRAFVSSYAKAISLSDGPYLIGERLNPTGKPRLKAALRAGDMDYLLGEALRQIDAGAHILDVNVGLPGIDEPALMEGAVRALQGVADAPLQLDSSDPEALERGLRAYAGCALINSVSGKASSMEAIFPLAKKYGACVVALTLDEKGIPETGEGRVEIARRIVLEAARYGIGPERIVIDPLSMAISAGAGGATAVLYALSRLREMGLYTVLGVSNVSFGLPERAQMNAVFFSMALERGLTLGIVNPLSAPMMDAWHTSLALLGLDQGCLKYIGRFGGREAAPVQQNTEMGLGEAVIRGLKGQSAALAKELLKDREPMRVIDEELIPALDKVGKAFEKGDIFLPQLLMSADAASAGFEAVREHLARTGGAQKNRGRVVLATVQGDIHDIGKNIVRSLLENYGFEVIDLGRDVPPERVVETCAEQNIRLVGLSALMTTTVGAMEKTIRQLREAGDYRVVVGGAVLTEAYARQIGADFYAKDAMQSVRYACEVFENAQGTTSAQG